MLKETKRIIEESDIIILMAGAGMGVDSGLADFRGDKGFWKAYPKLKNKINFAQLCTQQALKKNPKLAWSLYGHMFDLFNDTTPHYGFQSLLKLAKEKEDYFVVTSNIDCHFQKAGFDEDHIYEIHGRINTFQCTECDNVWKPSPNTKFNVDPTLMEMKEPPVCPKCNGLARPNIMMFCDNEFNTTETDNQLNKFNIFMNKYDKGQHKIAIIEIGAGEGVPTIRMMSEYIHENIFGATLIRINPIDIEGPLECIPIKMGGLDAITQLNI